VNVLFRALVLRWIARRRLRSALAVAAVALGTAAFLASAAVGDGIERTAVAAVAAVSGGADVGVEAGTSGVPAEWAQEIRGVPGVAAAAPVVLGWASVRGAAKGRALVVGVDPAAEAAMRRYADAGGVRLSNPLAFAAGAGAIVTKPLAEELGLRDGGSLAAPGPSGPVELTFAGTFEPRGAERGTGGRIVVVTLAAARRLLGRGALADRIDVRVRPDADAGEVAGRIVAQIGERAPPGLYVGPPKPVDPTAADVLRSINVAMRIGAVVALLIGMFLIHHTVAVGVAERRRDVGALRALGATRGQVLRVFAGEALLLGLVGSSLGVGLGFLLAAGALEGFAGSITSVYFSSAPAPARIGWPLALTALSLGTLVALAAAWFPAARAANEAPSDAIRRGPDATEGRRALSRPRVVVLTASAAAAAALLWAPDAAGRWSGYVAAGFALLAYLAAAPAILAVGARLLAPLLARRFGVPGRLAADQLERHPVRAALPAAALAVGLALVVETAGTMTTLSETTIEWMDSQVAGDLFVSSGRPVMGPGGGHTPLDASLAKVVAGADGVAHVVGVRFRHVDWRGTKLLVWGFDIAPYRHVARVDVKGGPRDALLADVEAGGACLVSENLTQLFGVGVGDVIELPGAGRVVPLRVVGSFVDYSWPRGTVIVDRAFMAREMDDELVDEFSVKLEDGADADAATRAVVAALGPERDVVVMSARQLQEAARTLMTSFFSLSYAQLAAALSVAFLGVVNALWIAVVLRRRELGLLRAVGATRRQVTASIVLEAAGLGVIGALCGLVGGALIEWIAVARVLPVDTGWTFPMRFPWGVATATAVLGIVTSAAAGLVPARAASRFSLREALAEE
jgi:putative ABC transport system permease protein